MWTYSKDGSEAEGDDTVWIDNIEFPIPIALKTAYNPDPSDGAVDVNPSVSLSWTAGSGAVTHDVYFSVSNQAVIDGTAPVAHVTKAHYGPLSLDLGKTYYWRVDEVEGSATHKGDVWNFTTRPPASMSLSTVGNVAGFNNDNAVYARDLLMCQSWLEDRGQKTEDGRHSN